MPKRTPFVLSLSKYVWLLRSYFDRLSTNGMSQWACVFLLAFLQNTNAQTIVNRGLETRGFAVMQDQRLGNCIACHAIPDAKGELRGIQSTFAPSLVGVGSRRGAEALRNWITDARRINPNTNMPPFGVARVNASAANDQPILNTADIDAVVAALLTLR